MYHQTARMTSILLAFGIFFSFSCNSLDNVESSSIQNQSLQEQIEQINREITENPDDIKLRVRKAELLFRYSQTIPDPANRMQIYSNIRDINESVSNGRQKSSASMDDLLERAWRSEHRSGISLIQKDNSELSEIELNRAIAHFENAVTVLPDSMKSYNVLASTHYQMGNINKAKEVLEIANSHNSQSNAAIKEKLAFLYLESGELDEAEKRYKELTENYPDKLLYRHGLINVLILSNQHQDAIQNLETLSEEYPTRYNYQESLATEIYFLFKKETEEYLEDGFVDLKDEEREALFTLLRSAHNIFESFRESIPTNEDNLFRMATFYKNTAMRLKDLSVVTNSQEDLNELYDEYLNYSLPLWEQLAEMNPENLEYISNLHKVYLELGMEEDANNLERSYNF